MRIWEASSLHDLVFSQSSETLLNVHKAKNSTAYQLQYCILELKGCPLSTPHIVS
jgi:hypothetical protein